MNRAKMGIFAYNRKQTTAKLLQTKWAEEEKAEEEAEMQQFLSEQREAATKVDTVERDAEGNEIGDDVWPSANEPFPYHGGDWQRVFDADGTIHHFRRDCPHCSGGEFEGCRYCGGTGSQVIGRGGRPMSKREMDEFWEDC